MIARILETKIYELLVLANLATLCKDWQYVGGFDFIW